MGKLEKSCAADPHPFGSLLNNVSDSERKIGVWTNGCLAIDGKLFKLVAKGLTCLPVSGKGWSRDKEHQQEKQGHQPDRSRRVASGQFHATP